MSNHVLDKSRLHLNKKVKSIESNEKEATVYCMDGTIYKGDLIVGADGIWSTVRREMWRLADMYEPGRISEKEKKSKTDSIEP